MAVAVVFAFLAACGFASGNVLVRVGTEKVPAPTATLLTVFSGIILIVGLTLVFRLDEISSLSIEALGWIVIRAGVACCPSYDFHTTHDQFISSN